MSADGRIVVVGAGQCAASAVATLRSRGFVGEIVLIGAEAELPYERPPLSKDYLLGETSAEELCIRSAEWYEENEIDVRLRTAVMRLDPKLRMVELSSGESLAYDRLLIATGGSPRRLKDVQSDRVLYLRHRDDSERLGGYLRAGEELLILGGGFIGCEVAASARKAGVGVTVLEMQDHPLQAVLGSRVGKVLSEIHRDAEVNLRTGERVLSITEVTDGLVVTTDRGRLECSRLLVAIGLEPNTGFLAHSGVECDNGVRVDEFCRTNVEGVYAAGDVASHYHPVFDTRVRVEHYDNAIKQGAAAADNMLGTLTPFIDAHWFWSDQYQHNLQSVGNVKGYDELVIRGEVEELAFSVFYLRGGVVRSVFAINRATDVSVGRRMVLEGFRPDPELLRDTDQNLRRMVAPAPTKAA
jgi:3-phenylpropionate/trans-cinnamate dioxygenase ferredoxin reductase subunit